MATRITYEGNGLIIPDIALVESADISSASRNIAHDILDGTTVFTLRPAAPSSGQFRFLFDNEQAAADCYDAHRLPTVFRFEDDARPTLTRDYVVTGDVQKRLDSTTAETFIVDVTWTEYAR